MGAYCFHETLFFDETNDKRAKHWQAIALLRPSRPANQIAVDRSNDRN
jgi:hypothetical protein